MKAPVSAELRAVHAADCWQRVRGATDAALDGQTAKERAAAEQRYLDSYPFHPELTEVFDGRCTTTPVATGCPRR